MTMAMMMTMTVTMIIIIIIIIKGSTQRYYIAGGVRRRGKIGNHGKVGVKRKWWVLPQLYYFPKGNGRQSCRVEPGGRPPDTE